MTDPAEPSRGRDRPIAVSGLLSITSDGDTLHLRGDGRRLILQADSLGTLHRLRRDLLRRPGDTDLDRLTKLLSTTRLHIEVRVHSQTVLDLDADHPEPNLAARALGLPGQMHLRAALKSLFT